ncbi:38814_t:CDS:2, partial [Gigaspora margarita]
MINSNKQDKNLSTIQQKQLDYFGITSNIIQENRTQHLNQNSAKRTRNENVESNIAEILQQLDGLSGQSLLKKILEDQSYTLYNDNKHVYCHSCQKPITLHRFNDGTRLKEHIITLMHLEKSQKVESKKMRTTFLTTFYSNNTPKVMDLTDKELNNFAAVTVDNSTPTVIDLTKSDKELAAIIVDNNNQVSKIEQHVNYAIFAKYGTSILNEKSQVQYTIFRNNDLYDGSDRVEGYFKSTKCLGHCSRKWCYEC